MISVINSKFLMGYGEDGSCSKSFNLQRSGDGKSIVELVDWMYSVAFS